MRIIPYNKFAYYFIFFWKSINSIIDDIIEDLTNNPLTFAGYIVTYITASALLMGAIIIVVKSMKR